MMQTMIDALHAMAALNPAGDETTIIDNANPATAIWIVIDDIRDNGDYLAKYDLVVTDERITAIDADGYLQSEPIYRRTR